MPSDDVFNRARWIVENERVFVMGEGSKLLHFLSHPFAREKRGVTVNKETGEFNCTCQHEMWKANKPSEWCACSLACFMHIKKLARADLSACDYEKALEESNDDNGGLAEVQSDDSSRQAV